MRYTVTEGVCRCILILVCHICCSVLRIEVEQQGVACKGAPLTCLSSPYRADPHSESLSTCHTETHLAAADTPSTTEGVNPPDSNAIQTDIRYKQIST